MGTLTIRLSDDKHDRLRRLAEQRQISINRLIDELATTALAEHDAYIRFQLRASRGSAVDGLRLLDKLDRIEAENVDKKPTHR